MGAVSVPPVWVRRVVLAPAIFALAVLALVFFPLLLLVAAFAVRWIPGRWRALRLLWMMLVYLVREATGLVALFVLWALSGFGWKLHTPRFDRAHVVVAGWFVGGLIDSARRVLGLTIVEDRDSVVPAHPPERPERPMLVFSRHAGAGDSFLLVNSLINTYGRRPLIVLKEQLRWDPCIDVALGRLPSRFIPANPPAGSGAVESISQLATEMQPDDALILFPEGGNFTDRRRRRAISRLGEDGLDNLVERAEALTQVLPPRPGGAFAAIDAAPDADIVFVAHTGLEQLSSPRQVWDGLPMRSGVQIMWWLVPAGDVPVGYEARISWLYEWWEVIDTWIDEHLPPDTPAGPISERVSTD